MRVLFEPDLKKCSTAHPSNRLHVRRTLIVHDKQKLHQEANAQACVVAFGSLGGVEHWSEISVEIKLNARIANVRIKAKSHRVDVDVLCRAVTAIAVLVA